MLFKIVCDSSKGSGEHEGAALQVLGGGVAGLWPLMDLIMETNSIGELPSRSWRVQRSGAPLENKPCLNQHRPCCTFTADHERIV